MGDDVDTSAIGSVHVTVVVVTYNSAAVLPDLIASFPDGFRGCTGWEAIFVDNASWDESVQIAKELCPAADIIRRNSNDGFAAGVNAALACLPDDRAVLLLNPDARLHPDSVVAMLRSLGDNIGIVAPRIVSEDGSTYPSLRRQPGIVRTLNSAILGERVAGHLGVLGELISSDWSYRKPRDVAWAGGAALLLAPGLTSRIGGLDESFFLYSEETEFALRAGRNGYRIRFNPDATVTHLGGDGSTRPELYKLVISNKVRLYARLHPGWRAHVYLWVSRLHQRLRLLRGKALARHGLIALRDRSLVDG